jgi:hypothetical protein
VRRDGEESGDGSLEVGAGAKRERGEQRGEQRGSGSLEVGVGAKREKEERRAGESRKGGETRPTISLVRLATYVG